MGTKAVPNDDDDGGCAVGDGHATVRTSPKLHLEGHLAVEYRRANGNTFKGDEVRESGSGRMEKDAALISQKDASSPVPIRGAIESAAKNQLRDRHRRSERHWSSSQDSLRQTKSMD